MFGDSERVLRFPAFVCGLVSLPLFYMAARAYLSRGAALLALALFSLSPSAIYWGANCKQYSSDVTFAIAALILGNWLVRHEPTRGRATGATLLGQIMPNDNLTLSLFDVPGSPRTPLPDATVSLGR